MSTSATITKTQTNFEATARDQGMLDGDGFFVQDQWEFDLDTIQDSSRDALLTHLQMSPAGNQTAAWLKGHLIGSDVHFSPFED